MDYKMMNLTKEEAAYIGEKINEIDPGVLTQSVNGIFLTPRVVWAA